MNLFLLLGLFELPDTLLPERREAADYLVRSLSPALLEAMGERLFLRNLELAFVARDEFPWARSVPDSVFIRYVLPPTVSQEPPEDWRGFLLDSLRPIVAGLGSAEEVAIAVNRWCGERIKYRPNQRRDQGPLETWRSGWGRCEEMTIFYICALRAVGVPAREAYTPWWPFTESNHAWTEIYVDGVWKYAGSCEPADSLCSAWFSGPARRSTIVLSVGLGNSTGPGIYRVGADYTLFNSTHNYRDVSCLLVESRPGDSLALSVFNYGALRPVAVLVAGKDGIARCDVGPGDYVLSGRNFSTLIEVRGDTTRLKPTDKKRLPNAFWLRYPETER
ncbi:MAG: transglutaminase-like domain-containing protein [candidate division WOR-3 bacterium]